MLIVTLMIYRLFRSRFVLPLWLVAALLWAPIWGQWHGIAHQVQQAVSAAEQVSDSATSLAHDSEGHAIGSALCQVLDHLGHVSALAVWPVQILLQSLPQAALAGLGGKPLGLQVWWAAQARAPPVQI
ncbi:hypothetical protein B9Z38_11130 [Limnohabitans sp. MMS-10A-160]|uniref:DUF2946 family protein n=1 Tax=unclassified Limnohabitans TaxID=2626134 RepID=UPI000D3BD709|nr:MULTISPECIES: DUF2946 family protein [unclassified Limnohabitans]PUE18921.1 hypothetical protein B9Z43_09600 [Limnohabitans sp. MMS-10A-192]PUE24473.1 hypothetical protein B9Z38_11130 [Limnohabitans sp. MMS-10A-160]